MINWQKEFERKRHDRGNTVFIEVACGQAVAIPKTTPVDQVNALAESQLNVMRATNERINRNQ